jgi:hypothetical protein
MGAVFGDAGVDDAELADDAALRIGEEREVEIDPIGEVLQKLDPVVTDRGDADAAARVLALLVIQLDQLALAVVSPVGGAVEEN